MSELALLFAGELSGREAAPVPSAARAAAEVVRQHYRRRAVFLHEPLCACGNAEAGIIREPGPVAAQIVRIDSRHAVSYVDKNGRAENDGIADLAVEVSVVGHRRRVVERRFAKGTGLSDVSVIQAAGSIDRVLARPLFDASHHGMPADSVNY